MSASGASYDETIKNLGGDPTDPFKIFPEVAELYAKRAAELKEIVAAKYAAKAEWAKANPELAAKLEEFFSGKAPKVDWAGIKQKANDATRGASATVLGALATQVENMTQAIFSLLNARLGNSKEAYKWFNDAYEPNLNPPFRVIAETKGGKNPYFVTGAGGVLQSVLMGFGGLNITDKGIVQVKSVLPDKWKKLTITGVGLEKKTYIICH